MGSDEPRVAEPLNLIKSRLSPAQIEQLVLGAMGFLRSPDAIHPIRLPIADLALHHRSLLDAFTAFAAAGVRLRFRTTATEIQLEVSHVLPEQHAGERTYDLALADGTILRRTLDDDGPLLFDDLPATDKVVEIWLPPGLGVRLHGLAVTEGTTVYAAPHGGRPWIVYGSSITQGAWVAPTQTWPAIVARRLGWNLTCLGFNGGCHLDPLVARAIAGSDADLITLKLGVNVHNLQTLRERTFGPLVHGFVATLRDRHPTTPITVVSPIVSPTREDSPISDIPVIRGDGDPLVGDLTLCEMRTILREVVQVWRDRGDEVIEYLDGRALLGHDDVGFLPDGLHPDSGGHALLAERFIARYGDGRATSQQV